MGSRLSKEGISGVVVRPGGGLCGGCDVGTTTATEQVAVIVMVEAIVAQLITGGVQVTGPGSEAC